MRLGLRDRNYARLVDRGPLNETAYQPRVTPTRAGGVPAEVKKWGPFSQLRWFRRFYRELSARTNWKEYHCDSVQHLGPCCGSCELDEEYSGYDEERCCCRAEDVPA